MISISETIINIRADKACYESAFFHAGFWVCLSYRVRRLRKFGAWYCIALLPLDILFAIKRHFVSDTKIPANIDIGKGLYLPHPNGVIINDLAKIGKHVRIFQQVTIGEWGGKAPVLEDNVEIFGGAKVFGGITIGVCSKVGANCVVRRDVAEYSVVSVAPVQVKKRKDIEQLLNSTNA